SVCERSVRFPRGRRQQQSGSVRLCGPDRIAQRVWPDSALLRQPGRRQIAQERGIPMVSGLLAFWKKVRTSSRAIMVLWLMGVAVTVLQLVLPQQVGR